MKSLAAAEMAAVAYTATFAAGSLISIRRGYTAAPLGLRTGNTVSSDVVRGFTERDWRRRGA